jgi:hypothetical protein
VVGNELVGERARQAALESSIFDKPLPSSDFQSLARPALMRTWQAKWGSANNKASECLIYHYLLLSFVLKL